MKKILGYGITIDNRPAFFDQYDDEETAVTMAEWYAIENNGVKLWRHFWDPETNEEYDAELIKEF